MSALTDALAKVQQIHENEQALADPVAMAWQAEIAFKQAVVDAITAMQVTPEDADKSPAVVDTSAADLAAANAKIAELEGQVSAGAAAVAAFDAVLHPPVDAAPSSTEPPAIAPSNTGV